MIGFGVHSEIGMAPKLLRNGVLGCQMPSSRASTHPDTLFCHCDRDLATGLIDVCEEIRFVNVRSGQSEVTTDHRENGKHLFDFTSDCRGNKKLNIVQTDGGECSLACEHQEDCNNVIAIAPDVMVAYGRKTFSKTLLRKAGAEIATISGCDCGRGRDGGHYMIGPTWRDPGNY